MPHAATNIDAVFRALSDPTRREVVARLAHGPRSVSELAAPFDMKLPSFVRHLKLLEQAGLVRSEKRGRVRTCRLEPEGLTTAVNWLSEQRSLWERRLDQLDDYLLTLRDEET
ncbi:MAG: metalloregulator ArsR/SmtB family transcription factor [Sandaracinaceae bacterium]